MRCSFVAAVDERMAAWRRRRPAPEKKSRGLMVSNKKGFLFDCPEPVVMLGVSADFIFPKKNIP